MQLHKSRDHWVVKGSPGVEEDGCMWDHGGRGFIMSYRLGERHQGWGEEAG